MRLERAGGAARGEELGEAGSIGRRLLEAAAQGDRIARHEGRMARQPGIDEPGARPVRGIDAGRARRAAPARWATTRRPPRPPTRRSRSAAPVIVGPAASSSPHGCPQGDRAEGQQERGGGHAPQQRCHDTTASATARRASTAPAGSGSANGPPSVARAAAMAPAASQAARGSAGTTGASPLRARQPTRTSGVMSSKTASPTTPRARRSARC